MKKSFSKLFVMLLMVSVVFVGVFSCVEAFHPSDSIINTDMEKTDKKKLPPPPVRKPEKGPSKNMPPIYRPPQK